MSETVVGKTLREWLSISEDLVSSEVSETARLDVEVLLLTAIQRNRTFLYTDPGYVLSDEEVEQFQQGLDRRNQGEPIAYIVGYREFWSLTLNVTPAVLIPRPETELLVEKALALIEGFVQRAADQGASSSSTVMPLSLPLSIVDVGTGSGAIALAIASEQPTVQMTAVDISDAALSVAIDNRDRNQLQRVNMGHSDLLSAFSPTPQFHMVVSNPPYIDPEDPHLSQGDVRSEPQLALVAENRGMALIERLVLESKERLLPDGYLLLEHGYDQGERVRHCLEAAGFTQVTTFQDLASLDRVTQGCWSRS